MAYPGNPQNQYLRTQVETASKEQLVVMLFDGIVRFTEQARKAIEENQLEDVHHRLMRAQAIIMELIYTVDRDKGGEIASNLLSLHAYAFNCLIAANMKKDVSKIDEVQQIYRELREGWVSAMKTLGINGSTAPVSIPTPAPVAKAQPQTAVAPKIPAQPVTPPSERPAEKDLQAAVSGGAYGMGKTASLSARQPGVSAIAHQQPRSAAMMAAYNNSRNIA